MFKPGDRVKLIAGNLSALPGATATVGPKGCDGYYVWVIWDRNQLVKEQLDGGYFAEQFVLLGQDVDYLNITREIVGR